MTVSSAIALFGAMVALAIIPSPSVFAAVARTMASGFMQGFVTTLGIVMGDLIFILVAVYGLWSVTEIGDGLLFGVKLLGSAYLIWLGLSLWRSQAKLVEIKGVTEFSGLSNFICGLLITLSDPKAILFYVSFLPAFLDLKTLSIFDTGLVMAIATVAVGGPKLGYAYMTDQSRGLFSNARAKQTINRFAGSIMIATGLFLITKR
ncbi:MAG: LysE family translocator [Thermosynechococcaceae cyanobacterium]